MPCGPPASRFCTGLQRYGAAKTKQEQMCAAACEQKGACHTCQSIAACSCNMVVELYMSENDPECTQQCYPIITTQHNRLTFDLQEFGLLRSCRLARGARANAAAICECHNGLVQGLVHRCNHQKLRTILRAGSTCETPL